MAGVRDVLEFKVGERETQNSRWMDKDNTAQRRPWWNLWRKSAFTPNYKFIPTKTFFYAYKVCIIDMEDTHNLEDVVYIPFSQIKARTWP